jgi:hypothetical protein
VEQRFEICSTLEVADVAPEEDVREKKRLGANGLSELFVVERQQKKPPDYEGGERYDSEHGFGRPAEGNKPCDTGKSKDSD